MHSIWESEMNSLPNGEHRYDDTEICDAFLDMILSSEKPSDLLDYVLNSRIAQAEAARQAEDAARMEEEAIEQENERIRQLTGMEPSEYDAFISSLEESLALQEGYENSEQYFNQLSEENDRETGSEAERGEESGTGEVQGQESVEAGAEEAAETGAGEVKYHVGDTFDIIDDEGERRKVEVRSGPDSFGDFGVRIEGVGDTALSPEDLDDYRNRAIEASEQLKPTDPRDAVRPDSAELGVNEANEKARGNQKPLSESEARDLMQRMEDAAVNDPEIALTAETWAKTFGLANSLETPIGRVKMGESQYEKFFDKKRSSEFGMAVLTLQDPDVIIAEPSQANEGQETERPYSYVFVKTFIRNGEKIKFYTSVTVQRDNMEVSVSSHILGENRLFRTLTENERVYTKEALFSNSSDGHLAEQNESVPDLLPTQENNASSESKGTEKSDTEQEKEEKSEEKAAETQQAEPKPIGHGAFGDIYDQFKGKAKEAIDFLIKKKSGEAIGALHHKDIGDIDLVWGEEGTGKSDGYGLAKLVKYHPDVLDNLQEILDDMRVTARSDNRVNLESDTHQAAVRLTWDNQKKTWLLTAFEKKNSALGNTTDTGETSSGGKRNDTATPQSTVSESKNSEKSDTEQEKEGKSEEKAAETQQAEQSEKENKEPKTKATRKTSRARAYKTEKTDEKGVDGSTISKEADAAEEAMRDEVVRLMREAGIEVVVDSELGQQVLDEGTEFAKMMGGGKKKATSETAKAQSPQGEQAYITDISDADSSAKVIKNIENLAKDYEKKSNQPRTFLKDVAEAIGAVGSGSKSKYLKFKAKNGRVVVLRLANHNASVRNFDNNDEKEGVSIVVSGTKNNGIDNNGEAHLVEFFYQEKDLRRADGKPLVEIIRSIEQMLYSGEYKDTTGLAKPEEVNADTLREMRAYHGSGADFDAFDHSHMGEGEGAQAYGWGTYVTEVEGIGRTYADATGRSPEGS